MRYEIATDNEIEKEIDISIPATALSRFIDIEVDKMQKDVTLRGFRKGRVPKSLIKNRYHENLKAQAMNDLVTESFLKILAEKKWRPASRAEMLNVEEGETIKFRLRFEIIPTFSVDNYVGLEIFKEEPLPDDFLYEQAMNELRERYAEIKETTRPAAIDDLVTANIEITENNTVKSKQNGITVKIGDRSLPDEINEALVGVHKSDKKEVKVGDQTHSVFIAKIEEKILPPVDDNLAKRENCANLEQLKKKLMEDVKRIEEKRIEDELKESLSNILLEKIQFKVPQSLIQDEYKTILQKSSLPDSESNKERFWVYAEKRARFDLIINKIAETEKIEVKDEEVVKLVSAMGMNLNSENRDKITNYIRNILGKEKTIDFLYKNAKISQKSRIISPKEDINDTSPIRH